ncbi:MAG: phosphoribosyltransferase [Saprospirales bacterium]|nr:MAG: phosphoribosyltransferase [Saprospirales bacterium]
MQILDNTQVRQKIKRLAYQIVESNLSYKKLYLLGINNNGMRFAQLLKAELEQIALIDLIIGNIRLNPANPMESEVMLDVPVEELQDKSILITDDVANTGRTIFYAFSAIMKTLPARVQIGVLVDRKHKNFPVHVDYVGMTLATTLKENIDVDIDDGGKMGVFLT